MSADKESNIGGRRECVADGFDATEKWVAWHRCLAELGISVWSEHSNIS